MAALERLNSGSDGLCFELGQPQFGLQERGYYTSKDVNKDRGTNEASLAVQMASNDWKFGEESTGNNLFT